VAALEAFDFFGRKGVGHRVTLDTDIAHHALDKLLGHYQYLFARIDAYVSQPRG
jgi:hypothetical protein